MQVSARFRYWRLAWQQARKSLGASLKQLILMSLLFYLMTSGLSAVIRLLLPDASVMSGGVSVRWIALNYVLPIYASIVNFGYRVYVFQTVRGEAPSYWRLLDGFAMAGKVAGLFLLRVLLLLLWELLFLIPQMVLVGVLWLTVFGGTLALDFYSALALAFAWALLILISLALPYCRYALADLCLLENPSLSAWGAIRQSIRLVQGHGLDMLALQLSSFGWVLLCSGVGMFFFPVWILWVLLMVPYWTLAVIHFYLFLTRPAGQNS